SSRAATHPRASRRPRSLPGSRRRADRWSRARRRTRRRDRRTGGSGGAPSARGTPLPRLLTEEIFLEAAEHALRLPRAVAELLRQLLDQLELRGVEVAGAGHV